MYYPMNLDINYSIKTQKLFLISGSDEKIYYYIRYGKIIYEVHIKCLVFIFLIAVIFHRRVKV